MRAIRKCNRFTITFSGNTSRKAFHPSRLSLAYCGMGAPKVLRSRIATDDGPKTAWREPSASDSDRLVGYLPLLFGGKPRRARRMRTIAVARVSVRYATLMPLSGEPPSWNGGGAGPPTRAQGLPFEKSLSAAGTPISETDYDMVDRTSYSR